MPELKMVPNVNGYEGFTAVQAFEGEEVLGTLAIFKLQDGKWILNRPGVSSDLCHTDELNRIALDAP